MIVLGYVVGFLACAIAGLVVNAFAHAHGWSLLKQQSVAFPTGCAVMAVCLWAVGVL